MTRAATWDGVDADLEMIQRDATFRALDGPLRVLERVRGNLAELRWRQGESEPLVKKPQLHLTSADVSKPTPTNKPGMDEVAQSRAKGFTGMPCEQCGSLDTVRNGTCLVCSRCNWSGECG